MIQDYWEVWKEETVMLAIVLEQCAIWAGPPLDTFCRPVQEFHRHLAVVIDKSDWANMEKEIWAGVMNDPMVAASLRHPMSKRTQSQTPITEKPMASIPPSTSEPRGDDTPWRLGSSAKKATTTILRVFFLQVPEDLILPALKDAYLLGAPLCLTSPA